MESKVAKKRSTSCLKKDMNLLSCAPCGFQTNHSHSYKRHLLSTKHQVASNGVVISSLTCNQCGYTTSQISALKKHLKWPCVEEVGSSVTQGKLYFCQPCQVSKHQVYDIKKHFLTKSHQTECKKNPSGNIFKCGPCQYSTNLVSQLLKHFGTTKHKKALDEIHNKSRQASKVKNQNIAAAAEEITDSENGKGAGQDVSVHTDLDSPVYNELPLESEPLGSKYRGRSSVTGTLECSIPSDQSQTPLPESEKLSEAIENRTDIIVDSPAKELSEEKLMTRRSRSESVNAKKNLKSAPEPAIEDSVKPDPFVAKCRGRPRKRRNSINCDSEDKDVSVEKKGKISESAKQSVPSQQDTFTESTPKKRENRAIEKVKSASHNSRKVRSAGGRSEQKTPGSSEIRENRVIEEIENVPKNSRRVLSAEGRITQKTVGSSEISSEKGKEKIEGPKNAPLLRRGRSAGNSCLLPRFEDPMKRDQAVKGQNDNVIDHSHNLRINIADGSTKQQTSKESKGKSSQRLSSSKSKRLTTETTIRKVKSTLETSNKKKNSLFPPPNESSISKNDITHAAPLQENQPIETTSNCKVDVSSEKNRTALTKTNALAEDHLTRIKKKNHKRKKMHHSFRISINLSEIEVESLFKNKVEVVNKTCTTEDNYIEKNSFKRNNDTLNESNALESTEISTKKLKTDHEGSEKCNESSSTIERDKEASGIVLNEPDESNTPADLSKEKVDLICAESSIPDTSSNGDQTAGNIITHCSDPGISESNPPDSGVNEKVEGVQDDVVFEECKQARRFDVSEEAAQCNNTLVAEISFKDCNTVQDSSMDSTFQQHSMDNIPQSVGKSMPLISDDNISNKTSLPPGNLTLNEGSSSSPSFSISEPKTNSMEKNIELVNRKSVISDVISKLMDASESMTSSNTTQGKHTESPDPSSCSGQGAASVSDTNSDMPSTKTNEILAANSLSVKNNDNIYQNNRSSNCRKAPEKTTEFPVVTDQKSQQKSDQEQIHGLESTGDLPPDVNNVKKGRTLEKIIPPTLKSASKCNTELPEIPCKKMCITSNKKPKAKLKPNSSLPLAVAPTKSKETSNTSACDPQKGNNLSDNNEVSTDSSNNRKKPFVKLFRIPDSLRKSLTKWVDVNISSSVQSENETVNLEHTGSSATPSIEVLSSSSDGGTGNVNPVDPEKSNQSTIQCVPSMESEVIQKEIVEQAKLSFSSNERAPVPGSNESSILDKPSPNLIKESNRSQPSNTGLKKVKKSDHSSNKNKNEKKKSVKSTANSTEEYSSKVPVATNNKVSKKNIDASKKNCAMSFKKAEPISKLSKIETQTTPKIDTSNKVEEGSLKVVPNFKIPKMIRPNCDNKPVILLEPGDVVSNKKIKKTSSSPALKTSSKTPKKPSFGSTPSKLMTKVITPGGKVFDTPSRTAILNSNKHKPSALLNLQKALESTNTSLSRKNAQKGRDCKNQGTPQMSSFEKNATQCNSSQVPAFSYNQPESDNPNNNNDAGKLFPERISQWSPEDLFLKENYDNGLVSKVLDNLLCSQASKGEDQLSNCNQSRPSQSIEGSNNRRIDTMVGPRSILSGQNELGLTQTSRIMVSTPDSFGTSHKPFYSNPCPSDKGTVPGERASAPPNIVTSIHHQGNVNLPKSDNFLSQERNKSTYSFISEKQGPYSNLIRRLDEVSNDKNTQRTFYSDRPISSSFTSLGNQVPFRDNNFQNRSSEHSSSVTIHAGDKMQSISSNTVLPLTFSRTPVSTENMAPPRENVTTYTSQQVQEENFKNNRNYSNTSDILDSFTDYYFNDHIEFSPQGNRSETTLEKNSVPCSSILTPSTQSYNVMQTSSKEIVRKGDNVQLQEHSLYNAGFSFNRMECSKQDKSYLFPSPEMRQTGSYIVCKKNEHEPVKRAAGSNDSPLMGLKRMANDPNYLSECTYTMPHLEKADVGCESYLKRKKNGSPKRNPSESGPRTVDTLKYDTSNRTNNNGGKWDSNPEDPENEKFKNLRNDGERVTFAKKTQCPIPVAEKKTNRSFQVVDGLEKETKALTERHFKDYCLERLCKNQCQGCNLIHALPENFFTTIPERYHQEIICYLLDVSTHMSVELLKALLYLIVKNSSSQCILDLTQHLLKKNRSDKEHLSRLLAHCIDALKSCESIQHLKPTEYAMSRIIQTNAVIFKKWSSEEIYEILKHWKLENNYFVNSWTVLRPLILSSKISLTSTALVEKIINDISTSLKEVVPSEVKIFAEAITSMPSKDFCQINPDRRKLLKEVLRRLSLPNTLTSMSDRGNNQLKRSFSCPDLTEPKVKLSYSETLQTDVHRAVLTDNMKKLVYIIQSTRDQKALVDVIFKEIREADPVLIMDKLLEEFLNVPESMRNEFKPVYGALVLKFALHFALDSMYPISIAFLTQAKKYKIDKYEMSLLNDEYSTAQLKLIFSEVLLRENYCQECVEEIIIRDVLGDISEVDDENKQVLNLKAFTIIQLALEKCLNLKKYETALMLFFYVLDCQKSIDPLNLLEYLEILLNGLFDLKITETAVLVYRAVSKVSEVDQIHFSPLTLRVLVCAAIEFGYWDVAVDLFQKGLGTGAYPCIEMHCYEIVFLKSLTEDEILLFICEWLNHFNKKLINKEREAGKDILISWKEESIVDFVDIQLFGIPRPLREVDESLNGFLRRLFNTFSNLQLKFKKADKLYYLNWDSIQAFLNEKVTSRVVD